MTTIDAMRDLLRSLRERNRLDHGLDESDATVLINNMGAIIDKIETLGNDYDRLTAKLEKLV